MEIKTLTKEKLDQFVQNLIKAGNVTGVKEKEGKYSYGPLRSAKELVLDYDVTLLPPKKYVMPQWETLLKYKVKDTVKVEEVIDAEPLTIIGVHPYDLKAINQLDKLFEEKYPDSNYLKRRASITIIAVTPKRASKWSFWSSMDSVYVNTGFDILLTDIGGKYAVETGTKRGEKLLKKYAACAKGDKNDLSAYEKVKTGLPKLCANDRRINTPVKDLHRLVESRHDSELWEKQAEKCYSCGSCNIICPTCYCFDVREDMELNLKQGKRYRVWDGCLLEDFAKVATGENFREERKERYMHRFFRKWSYLEGKLGEPACVGCGRCASVCLPDIADPVKVFNKL